MRAIQHSINTQIPPIPTVALSALVLVGLLAVRGIGDISRAGRPARAVADAAAKVIMSSEARVAARQPPRAAAQTAATPPLPAIRNDNNDSLSVDGAMLVNRTFPEREAMRVPDHREPTNAGQPG
jgi:hypothetical protein